MVINKVLLEEILQSIEQVDGFGSVEIIVVGHEVTQITTKKIKKTSQPPQSNGIQQKKTLDKAISMY